MPLRRPVLPCDSYLTQEDLGSEDGALGGASYNYNWTVSSYCLHPHANASNAADLDCRPMAESADLSTGCVGDPSVSAMVARPVRWAGSMRH